MKMVVYIVMASREWDVPYLFGVYGSKEAAEKAVVEALDGKKEWEGWYFDILSREVQ